MAHLNVFLFAGQSNMMGADGLCDGSGTSSRSNTGNQDLNALGTQQTADTAALFAYDVYNNAGLGYSVGDIRGHNGTSFGYETNPSAQRYKQIGPEVGFSRTLYAAGWRNICILKYGANYNALEGGRSAWVSSGTRWTDWQSAITTRLAQLEALGHTYSVRGSCWHQGIDDGLLHRSQADYETDLTQIIADMRAAWGNVPFIVARSVNSAIAGTTYMAPIRAAQVAVANTVANCAWVDVDDATLVNTHHIVASAHITIGGRFADSIVAEGATQSVLTVTGTASSDSSAVGSVSEVSPASGTASSDSGAVGAATEVPDYYDLAALVIDSIDYYDLAATVIAAASVSGIAQSDSSAVGTVAVGVEHPCRLRLSVSGDNRMRMAAEDGHRVTIGGD